MSTSDSRPFTAATSKLAYAQAFAGPAGSRRDPQGASSLRPGLRRSLLRRSRRA
jgi:hypothetical protein